MDSYDTLNNPEGRNQHKDCPRKNDQLIKQILTQYHHDSIMDRKKISHLLKVEHGVTMREFFSPNLSTDELPAHQFLKSVHNITIERGWLHVQLQWGDNVKLCFSDLVQWLWPQLIQQELDKLKHWLNTHTVQFNRNKILPSGVSSNVAMALHKDYGAEDCLQPVDCDVVKNLMVEIGGKVLVHFIDMEYRPHAQLIFDNLGFKDLTFQNVWPIFSAMLPLM
ncbi:hypothetical protein BDR05DRAFT_950211 [Suillus weaverae]|nr:hypothetical protein BDR05DRAFT_950211 [Suillus weaverae]